MQFYNNIINLYSNTAHRYTRVQEISLNKVFLYHKKVSYNVGTASFHKENKKKLHNSQSTSHITI